MVKTAVQSYSAALLLGACGAATPNNPASVPASGAAGFAIANAAAAGVLWVAGGCKIQKLACPYGSYCDETTGYCAVTKCSEGCPEGTECNEGLDRCQTALPARPPSDLLPQDDARAFPTTEN